jgi:hypothetical protein
MSSLQPSSMYCIGCHLHSSGSDSSPLLIASLFICFGHYLSSSSPVRFSLSPLFMIFVLLFSFAAVSTALVLTAHVMHAPLWMSSLAPLALAVVHSGAVALHFIPPTPVFCQGQAASFEDARLVSLTDRSAISFELLFSSFSPLKKSSISFELLFAFLFAFFVIPICVVPHQLSGLVGGCVSCSILFPRSRWCCVSCNRLLSGGLLGAPPLSVLLLFILWCAVAAACVLVVTAACAVAFRWLLFVSFSVLRSLPIPLSRSPWWCILCVHLLSVGSFKTLLCRFHFFLRGAPPLSAILLFILWCAVAAACVLVVTAACAVAFRWLLFVSFSVLRSHSLLWCSPRVHLLSGILFLCRFQFFLRGASPLPDARPVCNGWHRCLPCTLCRVIFRVSLLSFFLLCRVFRGSFSNFPFMVWRLGCLGVNPY